MITAEALAPVGLDVGVPVIRIGDHTAAGPVLSQIPRGADALALFDAIDTLVGQTCVIRFERQQIGPLVTR